MAKKSKKELTKVKVQKEKKPSFFKKLVSFLKKIHLYKNSDSTINMVVFVLICFGSFMIISTDVGQTASDSTYVLKAFGKQILFVFVSYVAMFFANRIFTFKWFAPLQWLAIVGTCALLFSTQFFEEIGGSRAWIRFGSISIQPSEFAKPVMILLVASAVYLAKRHPHRLESWSSFYRTPLIAFLAILLLILIQKDTGTLVIIFMITYICVLIPDYPCTRGLKKFMKWAFFIGIISILVLFVFTDIGTEFLAQTPLSHIVTRIENCKNPYEDVYGDGYQPANALYGIANSNIFGRGIGGSARKFGYLSQADSDYIFAVIIEETGIFGLFGIVILYIILLARLFKYAFKTNEIEYKVVLVGNAAYLFLHFFINIGGVISLIPMTGVPLLFISSGGSSLMAICVMIGISQKCISAIRNNEMEE